jgi:hypothetical protein
MNDKLVRHASLAFLIGTILILVGPFLLTRNLNLVDFSTSGQIGDTIGGITSPIVSLLGSLLVFFALKAQVDANSLIQSQIESQRNDELKKKNIQYFLDQFKIIREDINEFSFFNSEPGKHVFKKGSDAINSLLFAARGLRLNTHDKIFQSSPKLFELKMLLESIDSLLAQLQNSDLDPIDKSFYKSLIAYQYRSNINGAFQAHSNFRSTITTDLMNEFGKAIPEELFVINDIIISKLD